MKKSILAVVGVCAAACSLVACVSYEKQPETDEYKFLNDMLSADYSQIVLTVTDTFDEDTSLRSVYTMTYSGINVKVEYEIEKFSQFDLSLDGTVEEVKTTLKGEILIQGGVVTSRDGDNVDLTEAVADLRFSFKADLFENAELNGNFFKADVKEASRFLGSELTCTDMKIYATFIEVFNEIQITYTSESGSSVKFGYIFSL